MNDIRELLDILKTKERGPETDSLIDDIKQHIDAKYSDKSREGLDVGIYIKNVLMFWLDFCYSKTGIGHPSINHIVDRYVMVWLKKLEEAWEELKEE